MWRERMRCSDPLLHTLPDHVLLLIFAKISDPKSLLTSFLISKRIASILSHSHSLSLQFPTPVPFPPRYPSSNFTLTHSNPTPTPSPSLSTILLRFTFPFRFLHQIVAPQSLPPPPPSSSSLRSEDDLFSRLTNLLCRFNAIWSIRIELPCSCYDSDDVDSLSTVFKWKAKASPQFEIFSLLSSTLVRKLDDELEDEDKEEEEEEDEEEDDDDDNLVRRSYYEVSWRGPRGFAASMHHLMVLLIARHPNLQSVEITDSKKHGGLTIQGEELIKVRNALDKERLPKVLDSFDMFTHFKVWYEPKLRLRLSGFEMEGVKLVMCRGSRVVNGKVEDDDDVDAALAGEFEDDGDGVFREAMTQLLTKHRMRVRVGPF